MPTVQEVVELYAGRPRRSRRLVHGETRLVDSKSPAWETAVRKREVKKTNFWQRR